ncbi:hypothetical protein C5167_023840 [Papaver somniferum]|uniref:Secreted protein n=1 Tax=Papaver somniferum TaxID=3469 RepID=A0A4Y7JLU0_PAPSO|nr:hypothetical protein C5167_023840 [Papaver somniferum]
MFCFVNIFVFCGLSCWAMHIRIRIGLRCSLVYSDADTIRHDEEYIENAGGDQQSKNFEPFYCHGQQ